MRVDEVVIESKGAHHTGMVAAARFKSCDSHLSLAFLEIRHVASVM